MPAGYGEQVPGVTLQPVQMPVHEELQQNPSTQWPESHCPAEAHGVPFVCVPEAAELAGGTVSAAMSGKAALLPVATYFKASRRLIPSNGDR